MGIPPNPTALEPLPRKTYFPMMRIPIFLGLILCAAIPVRAEDIVLISGGPALRSHERFKPNTHDRYWGNFVDSALARVKELR